MHVNTKMKNVAEDFFKPGGNKPEREVAPQQRPHQQTDLNKGDQQQQQHIVRGEKKGGRPEQRTSDLVPEQKDFRKQKDTRQSFDSLEDLSLSSPSLSR